LVFSGKVFLIGFPSSFKSFCHLVLNGEREFWLKNGAGIKDLGLKSSVVVGGFLGDKSN